MFETGFFSTKEPFEFAGAFCDMHGGYFVVKNLVQNDELKLSVLFIISISQ